MLQRLVKATNQWMPTAMAFHCCRILASRPPRAEVSAAEQAALAQASRLFELDWSNDAAWSWGSGPTVVLIHGWGGRAAQMAPLAVELARSGLRAVAFDVAGHGESAEPSAGWEYSIRDIAKVSRQLGSVAGYVGHSAGGLSLMAARRIHGLSPAKYVCVCAPSHPYPPVRGLAQRLDPRPSVLQRYRTYLGAQFQTDWRSLEAGAAYLGAGDDLLLCYDRKDRFVDPDDGNRIHALCPGSRLLTSDAYGHTRILRATEVMREIAKFLNDEASRIAAA